MSKIKINRTKIIATIGPASSDYNILKENYVMTVEPGIYVKDIGGVRIEDDIIVTNDGAEILNQTSKEFQVIS